MQPDLPSFTFVDDLFPRLSPSALCTCAQPIPKPRAERKGAARTYCARCELPIPLLLGEPGGQSAR